MTVKFNGVLTGVAVGLAAAHCHALIDHPPLGIVQRPHYQLPAGGLGQGMTQRGKNLLCDFNTAVPAQPDNPDGADLTPGGDGSNCVRHARLRLKKQTDFPHKR